MKKQVTLILLALLTITGAMIEGLVEGLSPQMVQVNGLLTIVLTGTFIFSTLRAQID